jgi:hypothetical protein
VWCRIRPSAESGGIIIRGKGWRYLVQIIVSNYGNANFNVGFYLVVLIESSFEDRNENVQETFLPTNPFGRVLDKIVN